MKKTILIAFVLCSLFANSQNIDTVKVRSLTLQAQDWAWLCGQLPDGDSLSIVTLRTIRTKVQAASNPTWTTNITLDSIPGVLAVRFYAITMSAPALEISARYTAIKNALSSKTNIAYWLGMIDGQASSEYDRKRTLGKNKILD